MVRSLAVFISLLAVVLTGSRADAKCASYSEWLVTEQVAGPTPSIVVAVYEASTNPATTTFELLTPRGERVPLREQARYDGWRTQHIVYVPTKALSPGTHRLMGQSKRSQALSLEVLAAPATLAAMVAPQLSVLESQVEQFGCGPAENLRLAVGKTDAKLALVTLTDATGAHTGYATIDTDGDARSIAIGHGMCSGMWSPAEGVTYTISVRLVGLDGKAGPATTLEATFDPK